MSTMLLALAVSQSAAPPPLPQEGNPEVRRALATLELASDEKMSAIYDAYFSCYLASVEKSPASKLNDDAGIAAMFRAAFDRCGAERTSAMKDADAYLRKLQPGKTELERQDLLSRTRAALGWFRLRDFFAEKGLADQYVDYLGRLARKQEKLEAVNAQN